MLAFLRTAQITCLGKFFFGSNTNEYPGGNRLAIQFISQFDNSILNISEGLQSRESLCLDMDLQFKYSYYLIENYMSSIQIALTIPPYQTNPQTIPKLKKKQKPQYLKYKQITTSMGNQTQKPPLPSQLKPIQDSRYGGNIMIDSNKTKVYQIFDIDQNNIDSFSNMLKSRKQISHPNLLTVNRTWVDDYRQDCSFQKMYRVTVEYLYIPFTLEDQIRRYCDLRVPVPENFVRRYFGQVVSCLDYLKSRGTCHGDIKPKNILIDKNRNAALTDSFFINGGRISYEIVIQDPQSLSLLSPAQLESLKGKKFSTLKEVHEDEIFGVGLTMIETMTAEPAMEAYDLANLKLKTGFLQKKYWQMQSYSYSQQLCQLVMKCVEVSAQKRINFKQFLQGISMGQNMR